MVRGVLAFHAFRAAALSGSVGLPLVVLAACLGPGCSVAALAVAGDGGALAPDGDDDNPGIGPLDGSACQPGDVRTFVPATYRPSTPVWQDVCSTDQMNAFRAACIDTTATTASCSAFSQSDPA